MFCPTCANVLVVEEGPQCYRFACHTCPFIHNVTRKVNVLILLIKKKHNLYLYFVSCIVYKYNTITWHHHILLNLKMEVQFNSIQ